MPSADAPILRILKTIKANRSGCWCWTASKTDCGYGCICILGESLLAHRVSYEVMRGQIPAEKQIDHLCRNRGCVNPLHMELVTVRENVLRGVAPPALNARKTRCVNGHAFDGKNTSRINEGKYRVCKACRRNNQARYAWKKRLAAVEGIKGKESK